MNKASLIGRATINHADGSQTIIEVHNDAGLHDFYRWYTREKGKRVKVFNRFENRNGAADLQALVVRTTKHFESLQKIMLTPGVSAWAGRRVTSSKVVIFKKRQYRRFLDCSVNSLPGYKPATLKNFGPADGRWVPDPFNRSTRRPVIGQHTTLQRKMDILTGRG